MIGTSELGMPTSMLVANSAMTSISINLGTKNRCH
jgi:hypothetical protein